jgi:glycosyltransferase involved in cell wall biosynthesis
MATTALEGKQNDFLTLAFGSPRQFGCFASNDGETGKASRGGGLLNILFWNQLFSPSVGGVEVFTQRLAQKLIERGHRVGVIADQHKANLSDTEIMDSIEIFRVPFRNALNASKLTRTAAADAIGRLFVNLEQINRVFKPDVVHVNFTDGSSFFHLQSSRRLAPTVVAFHCPLLPGLSRNGLISKLMQRAVANVCMSRTSAENVAEMTGFPREKLKVIAPGIRVEDFERLETPFAERARAIVLLGRLVREKGADLAIKAATIIRAMGIDFTLHIVGDGPERGALEAMVHDAQLGSRVCFHGLASNQERRKLLAESRIQVAPSRIFECFGIVAIEGALSGLPVVATPAGAFAEVILDGETGILTPPEDAGRLAENLAGLLESPSRCAELGAKAYAHALAHYTIDRTAEEYEGLYSAANRAN